MTIDLANLGVRAVLLDIEGTTTPMAFVHDILFPFARKRLAAWRRESAGSVDQIDIERELAAEHAEGQQRGDQAPAWRTGDADSFLAYATWLMDRDSKSPGLKRLQGLIWEQGYQAGELHGEVYPDVPPALRRWRDAGVAIAIYSSGSELAQRRLFASTEHGDLTPLVTAFFDTAVGPKNAAASYLRIASALSEPPSRLLFLSDITAELAAAREAGCHTGLSLRPGNREQPYAADYPSFASFDDVP